jgi:hypothetical protein
MKKFFLFALILVSATSALQPVMAYVPTGYKWPSPTTAMYISIGAPWDDAFITAMARWNQSAAFQFTYVPEFWDPCANPNNPPRHNGVSFSDTLCGESFGDTTLAVTKTWTTGGTTEVQSGIVFNTKWTWDVYDGAWGLGTYMGKSDFRRVAVHELGHVMGLDHENSVPSIMSTSVGTGNTIAGPQPDDIAGINTLYGGGTAPTDTTGPSLSITSHTNGQTVSTSSITLSGTATDAGRGDNGISSVTVNGVRAMGDAATGTSTANWSRTLTLNSGANTITVVATDSSSGQNATTSAITINYSPPPPSSSPTANTYHVFPQFADGRLSDGSSYRTTLMVANPSSSATSNCALRLYGLTVNGQDTYPFTFVGSGWTVLPISSTQPLKSGYATLQCSAAVEAQLLYSFYSAAGAKISEATVFSSPSAAAVEVLGDNRNGSQIAVAIANDSDQSTTYTITAYNNGGSPVGSATRTLAARTNLAAYVSDLVTLPADYYGQVFVTSGTGTASLIGIRFTGNAFTTIPAVSRSSVAPTAATYHVFPQFADGRASDGSYYRTTVMIINSSNTSGTCTLRLYGLTVNGSNVFSYGTFSPGTWTITTSINSTQNLQSGYATLQCGMPVEAQLLYSFYSASGTKISEATVFSSPAAGSVQVLADNREASSLAIAIANDSDQSTAYTITAFNSSGIPVGTVSRTIAARRNLAAFLSDLIPLPANHYGPVLVTSGGGAASIIGIRFTGGTFTTIPETIR